MAKANNADSSDRRVGIGSSTVLRSVCRCAHVVLLCNITLIDLSWIAALTLLSMSQRFNMESGASTSLARGVQHQRRQQRQLAWTIKRAFAAVYFDLEQFVHRSSSWEAFRPALREICCAQGGFSESCVPHQLYYFSSELAVEPQFQGKARHGGHRLNSLAAKTTPPTTAA
jgi:hypothetical protein